MILSDELDHESKGAELVVKDFLSPEQHQQAGTDERLRHKKVFTGREL